MSSRPPFAFTGAAAWVLSMVVVIAPSNGARAEPLTISGRSDDMSLRLTEPMPATEVVAALASAFGTTVTGELGQDLVSPNVLQHVSLNKALSMLLPHTHFVIRFEGAEASPEAILFLAPAAAAAAPRSAVMQSPSATAPGNPAGIAVPGGNTDEFVKTLPMLKTH